MLVEGAGSASEVNLRRYDIANMGFARAANVPVVIIGDIDRGGVIASLVGTKAVLDPDDAALVAGFIINKFRGDPSLFIAGKEAIVQATGWPALGFVPYFSESRHLPAEDALALDHPQAAAQGREAQGRRADPAADRQFRRSRSAGGGSRTSIWSACIPARRCRAMPISSSCRARRRRSPGSRRCAKAASTSTSPRMCAAAARCLACAAAIRCSAGPSPIPIGIEGPAGTVAGLGLLDVETVLISRQDADRMPRARPPTAFRFPATRCTWA